MTFERIILLGELYPEGFGEVVNINSVWVCRRGLSEHLVRHVVAGAHGPSVGRERLGVGQSDQAEIAHEILAIEFKGLPGLMSRCPIPCSFFNRDNVSAIERIAETTFPTLAPDSAWSSGVAMGIANHAGDRRLGLSGSSASRRGRTPGKSLMSSRTLTS